ncbi:MAG: hypothetical protein KC561_16655, partial [Myxococcales bacterium]|nr:hypothetical protein [Myxococcales bacterium]
VQWHPSDRDLLAYTSLGAAPWVEVADLGLAVSVCQLRDISPTPARYAAGAWDTQSDDGLTVFSTAPGTWSTDRWVFDPEAERCLSLDDTSECPLGSGIVVAEAPATVLATPVGDGASLELETPLSAPNSGQLRFSREGSGCAHESEIEIPNVAAFAPLSAEPEPEFLFIRGGALFQRTGSSEVALLDPATDSWSVGQYQLVELSHDGQVFIARSTTSNDQALYVFRRTGSGAAPWPNEETFVLAGPAYHPSLERFYLPVAEQD